MIRINKNKNAAKFYTSLIAYSISLFFVAIFMIDIIFLNTFVRADYILIILVIIGVNIVCLLIYIIIVKCTKTYYIINDKGIAKYKNDKLIFMLEKNLIVNFKYGYVSVLYQLLLLGIGGGPGELSIHHKSENQKIKLNSYKNINGKDELHLSVSLKQAKQIAEKLNRYLTIVKNWN